MDASTSIDALIVRMEQLLAPLEESGDARRYFLSMYLRTTRAVAAEIEAGHFVDPAWTERWDIAFAELYLDAVEQWNTDRTAPGPWPVAFGADDSEQRLPPIRHLLLGMNAHINYDLPQALLAVISDDEFTDPALLAKRQTDHRHIDTILTSRVAEEDHELRWMEQPGDRTVLERLLTPFQRRASRTFLEEGRQKVWRNAILLSEARRAGRLDQRLAELGALCSARVADLLAPGQVVLRLARDGFGVELRDDHAT
jgi:hypothetical protein